MSLEIKGNIGIELDKKRTIEINFKETKIVLNIKKIGKITKLIKLMKTFSEEKKEEKNHEEGPKEVSGKEKINKALKLLKEQGYSVSIKLKGITLIGDLESSSLSKLMNFL